MRHKRPGRRTTMQSLQHGGFHLQEPLGLQIIPQRPHHLNPGQSILPRLLPHNQVRVTMPHPHVLAHISERHRQRPQGLRCHMPRRGQHRQLTPLRHNHPAPHRHDVAQIHIRLPRRQQIRAHLGQRQHCLNLRATPLLDGGKAQLAGVTNKQHPAGNRHLIRGLIPSPQIRHRCGMGRSRLRLVLPLSQHHILIPQISDRDCAIHNHRVRLTTGLKQLLPFLPTDPLLLRHLAIL